MSASQDEIPPPPPPPPSSPRHSPNKTPSHLAPELQKEIVARRNRRESKDTFLAFAYTEIILAKFHKMTDAKEINGLEGQEAYANEKLKRAFCRECRIKGNQDNRRRDAWNSRTKDGSRTGQNKDSKALVTIDGEGVDWTNHSEDDDIALMVATAQTQTPEVWSAAPIIEEYESDSEDEYVCIPTKQQETPSFANQQVKTPRENIKSQFTHSQKPKVDKKELVAGITRTGKIPVNTARASGTKHFSTARQSFNRQTVLTSTTMKVNTVKPTVNRLVLLGDKGKLLLSPHQIVIGDHKDTTGTDYPHRALKNKGIVDSGCSRHMTGNKAYLAEFQDFNGGPDGFWTESKELQHFKLPVKTPSILKSPDNKDNMYSFNLENIVPSGGLACLIAKATTDESNKWHRRLGHVNFKKLKQTCEGKPCQQEANQNAGTEDIIDAWDSKKEDESAQDCFRDVTERKEQVFMDELERLKRQEKEANKEAEALRKKFEQETENLVIQEGAAKTSNTNIFSTVSTPAKANSTNLVNTVSIPVSTASPHEGLTLSDPTNPEQDDSEIPPLEDIYQNSFDDSFLGDPTSAVQTRSKVNTSSGAHAFNEPKKISEALEDESWVDVMQEELLQFKIQKVWVLVDLPYGKKAIGTKWVYRNKKDERGVVVRNKARLVAQGHMQEEGIDYDEDKYVAEILKKFDFANVELASTPFKIRSLVSQRPDIMFAVCACSRFQVTPKSSHLSAVKRIFRYLKGKPKLGLWYPKVSTFDLEILSDSDYDGAILPFVVLRLSEKTTEAEYVAAASCCGQNPVYHSKTKHIAIRHHFIRDAYEKKLIQVLKIHTDDNVADLLTKAFDVSRGLIEFRDSLRRVTDGTEALLIPTLFILWLDKVSTDSAKLVPLGKVCTAIETLKKNTAKALISLFPTITLSITMAVLDSCPKHNMVAYLEKSEGNAEFHEIIDFLTRSSIHHALTVSPVVSTTFVEQFWTSAKSKIINNVRHITAKVAGKPVSISEASIRSDLLFDDANGIDSLPNQVRFVLYSSMGMKGIVKCSKSTSWDQIPTNIATAVICLTSNQKYNFSKLIFDGMLRHLDAKKKFVMYPRFISIFLDKQLANVPVPLDHFPVNALTNEGVATSERLHLKHQPTPSSCLPTSEVPFEPQTDPSPRPSPFTIIPDSIPESSWRKLVTDKEKVSTDRPIVSTDGIQVSYRKQMKFLREKEKGCDLKDIEETDRDLGLPLQYHFSCSDEDVWLGNTRRVGRQGIVADRILAEKLQG
ncbi:putative ribonuclease H-like domain-containing protein [Tanacetum coccineum]